MRILSRIIPLLLLPFLAAALSSCLDEYGDPAHQRVSVDISLRDTPSNALSLSDTPYNYATGESAAQFGTSLIIAVPNGTTPTPRYEQLPNFTLLPKGLLDLANSTVQGLTLPVSTPLQLFEYTLNDTVAPMGSVDPDRSQDTNVPLDLLENPRIVSGPNVSTPFGINSNDTAIQLSLPVQTTSFTEDFSGALDPMIWQPAIGDVTISGGEAVITGSANYNASNTFEQARAGKSSRIRNNRNLRLNSQRVAGKLRIESVTISDSPSVDPPAADGDVAYCRAEWNDAHAPL